MTIIRCTKCGEEIERSEALTKDIEKTVLAAEHAKHAVELKQFEKKAAEAAAKSIAEVETKAIANAKAVRVQFG